MTPDHLTKLRVIAQRLRMDADLHCLPREAVEALQRGASEITTIVLAAGRKAHKEATGDGQHSR